jgi:hypothetical protein
MVDDLHALSRCTGSSRKKMRYWNNLESPLLLERPEKTATGKACLTMLSGIGRSLAIGNG